MYPPDDITSEALSWLTLDAAACTDMAFQSTDHDVSAVAAANTKASTLFFIPLISIAFSPAALPRPPAPIDTTASANRAHAITHFNILYRNFPKIFYHKNRIFPRKFVDFTPFARGFPHLWEEKLKFY